MLLYKLFVPLLAAFLFGCNANAQNNISLSPKDFEKGITGKDIQILDVRTMEEYQSGHIKKALLADWTNQDQFKERVAALAKTKPVYTYCLSGGRSGQAASWMRKNGFETVFNLEGGTMAWKKANLPLEGKQNEKQMTIVAYDSLIPSDKTVLVDIGAVWCPPCVKMTPVIDSLTTSKDLHFILVKIDGGEQEQLVKELAIEAFPTFIIYKNGKEIWRKKGIISAEELAEKIN